MSTSRNNTGLWILLVAGLAVTTSLTVYVRTTPASRVPEDSRRLYRDDEEPPLSPANPRAQEVTVLTPVTINGELQFDRATETAPPGTDAMVYAVNRYIENTELAPGAKLIDARAHDGILVLTFNEAFDRTYGTMDEGAMVNGILETVAQFDDVSKVQFMIGERPMATMGNIDLTQPQDVR